MAFKAAPLPHEWMITSVIGFFIALLLVYGHYGHCPIIPQGEGTTVSAAQDCNPGHNMFYQKWGLAFMILFVIMFLASMVSMTKAGTDPEDLDVLAAHYRRRQQ